MNDESSNSAEDQEIAPGLTYAPAAMAMGIAMTAMGILTHWTMSLAGAGLFVWALTSWMREICCDWRKRDDQ